MGLLTSAGLSKHDLCYYCPGANAVLMFFDYLGLTYDCSYPVLASKRILAFVAESNSIGYRYWVGIVHDAGGDGDPWTSIQNIGHFLVREAVVPIPPALWLCGSGLCGIPELDRRLPFSGREY